MNSSASWRSRRVRTCANLFVTSDSVSRITEYLSCCAIGRQLFEKDSSLVNSDAAFEEEGATSVDASQYIRSGLATEADEIEARGLGDLNLSDSD